jgi:hypothetical protein
LVKLIRRAEASKARIAERGGIVSVICIRPPYAH